MADLSFFGLPDGESDGGDSGGGLDGAMARLHLLTLKVCIPVIRMCQRPCDLCQDFPLSLCCSDLFQVPTSA